MRRYLSARYALLVILFVLIPLAITLAYKQRARLRAEAVKEEKNLLANLFDQRSALLLTFVDEYGYWDDLVDFIHNPERQWAQNNIAPCLTKYDADAIWIYGRDGSLAYAVTSESMGKRRIPPTTDSITSLFARSRFCHYFIHTPNGFLEIRGATVHCTADNERKTPPTGYLLAGRLWTNDYVASISKLWHNRIDILPNPGELHDRLATGNGLITFTVPLLDGTGKSVAQIITSRESAVLSRADDLSRTQLLLCALFLLATLILGVTLLDSIRGGKTVSIVFPEGSNNEPIIDDGQLKNISSSTSQQVEPSSEFLLTRSRIIKRADFQNLNERSLRIERIEMENRINKRLKELIQSYEPEITDQNEDALSKPYSGIERRDKPRMPESKRTRDHNDYFITREVSGGMEAGNSVGQWPKDSDTSNTSSIDAALDSGEGNTRPTANDDYQNN